VRGPLPSGSATSIESALARQPWGLVLPWLERASVDADRALEQLRLYAGRLLEWNRSVSNIMSRADEERIVARHLVESITPAAWLRESGARRWVDFGSGAGFPAIPLAIAGVPGEWTLIESRRMKTLFIRKMIQELSLHDFDVVCDRLENVVMDPARAAGFDGFTSRATMRLGPTLSLAAPIVKVGGSAFLWKGSGVLAEMEKDPAWHEFWAESGSMPVGSGPNVVARFTRK